MLSPHQHLHQQLQLQQQQQHQNICENHNNINLLLVESIPPPPSLPIQSYNSTTIAPNAATMFDEPFLALSSFVELTSTYGAAAAAANFFTAHQQHQLQQDSLAAASSIPINNYQIPSTSDDSYSNNSSTMPMIFSNLNNFNNESLNNLNYCFSSLTNNNNNLSPSSASASIITTTTMTPSTTAPSSSSTIGLLPSIASLELNNNYLPNHDLTNIPMCEFCGIPISAKTMAIVEGKIFHETCLRCYECGIQLDEKCYYRDGGIYCRNDYLQKFIRRQCSRCFTSIKPQELIMNVKDLTYFHLNCFTCVICGDMLKQGENFMLGLNGALTCYKHLDSSQTTMVENNLLTSLSDTVTPLPSQQQIIATTTNIVKNQSKKAAARLQAAAAASRKSESLSGDEEDGDDRESSTPDEHRHSSSKDRMGKRMRTSFKHHQLREMKRYFQLNHNPDAKDLKGLAQKTGLTKRVLQVWFQNARAKYRRSQANNPNASTSPNGCILPPIKFEQCYPTTNTTNGSSTSISGESARASTSPFECNGGTTNSSSFSRSISPEFAADNININNNNQSSSSSNNNAAATAVKV